MKTLEAWKEDVKKKHPQVASKLKFVSKDNGKHVSAEVPGEDRSYGVFDVNAGKGQVLEAKNVMLEYLESLDPVNQEDQADLLTEGFLDWFKKNKDEGKTRVFRMSPEQVAAVMKKNVEAHPDVDFSIKDDIYGLSNDNDIVDALITMLGVPRDGTPYKIRTGYMSYSQKNKVLMFAKNKYDLPGFIGRRPK